MQLVELIVYDWNRKGPAKIHPQIVHVEFGESQMELFLSLVRTKNIEEQVEYLGEAFKGPYIPSDICHCPRLAEIWRNSGEPRDPLVAVSHSQTLRDLSENPQAMIQKMAKRNRDSRFWRFATTAKRYLDDCYWLPVFNPNTSPIKIIREKIKAMGERSIKRYYIQTPLEQAMVDYDERWRKHHPD